MVYGGGGIEALLLALSPEDASLLNPNLDPNCQVDATGAYLTPTLCRYASIQRQEEFQDSNFFQSDLFKTALTSVASVLTGGASAITGAITQASLDEQISLEDIGNIALKTATSAVGGEILTEVETAGGFMFDDLFSGVGDWFSSFSVGDYLPSWETISSVGAIAAPIVQTAFAPQPTQSLPVMNLPSTIGGYSMTPTPTAAGSVMIPGAGGAVSMMAAALRPILFKIASKLGLRTLPSLSKAMTYIRNLGKAQLAPAAIATALGITVDELAHLIVADKHRKRRRMNPANSKALRRAARRIESFHRLCSRTDMLRSRGRRRAPVGAACGTCRKRPCRC